MAMAYNAYRNNIHLREGVNTFLHGAFWYAMARIAGTIAYSVSGDPTIDMAAQMLDAYSPLIGSIGAARYAYTSHDNFTRIVLGPVTLGVVGLGLGASISATPDTNITAIDDVVGSLQRFTNGNLAQGYAGTHLLGAGGIALGIFNNIRRREPNNNPVPAP